MAVDDLRQSPMMAHLLDGLEAGKDIGHYGRLTVAMVGQWFVDRDALVRLLQQGRGIDAHEAQALVEQVRTHKYNPPSRAQILAWQALQDFPLCPTPNDPEACNLYHDLRFPETVYADIEAYRQQHGAETPAAAAIRPS
jgi:hypothetical protein